MPVPLKRISSKGVSYAVLPGRASLVSLRNRREKISRLKWAIANKAAHMLRFIPTIELVGVTGGVALNNASAQDDIDFFCLTSGGTLWTSRFVATLLLDALGMRRKPHQRRVANKICLNMFMQEGSYTLGSKERDLFAAHEVLHMTPLWHKGDAYRRFLEANPWVRTFLPNAWEKTIRKVKKDTEKKQGKSFYTSFVNVAFRLLEPWAKRLELWYMRERRTSEVIDAGVLRFHPKDARVWVLRAFRQKLARFGIPLDNVFFAR